MTGRKARVFEAAIKIKTANALIRNEYSKPLGSGSPSFRKDAGPLSILL